MDAYRAGSFVFEIDGDIDDVDGVIPRLFGVFGTASPGSKSRIYTVLKDRPQGPTYRLLDDGEVVASATSLGGVVDRLITDVTRCGVAAERRGAALHAGVVSLDGAGVVLPGGSGAGKSTLVAGLVAAGAAYLSDEVAVIDRERAIVHPFPRPLMLDPDSLAANEGLEGRIPPEFERFRLLRHHVVPQDLRPGSIGTSSPIGLVVEPRYERDAPTTLEPLSRAEVLYTLASHLFGTTEDLMGALGSLRRIALEVPGYRLHSGELAVAVREVLGAVRQGRRRAVPPSSA